MEINEFLKLIADFNRTRIILYLKKGEICVCDLAQELGIEQSLLSHHLKKMKILGLVKERRLGRWVHYSLDKKIFEDFEKQYLQMFGSKNISEERCSIHIECCKDPIC